MRLRIRERRFFGSNFFFPKKDFAFIKKIVELLRIYLEKSKF